MMSALPKSFTTTMEQAESLEEALKAQPEPPRDDALLPHYGHRICAFEVHGKKT